MKHGIPTVRRPASSSSYSPAFGKASTQQSTSHSTTSRPARSSGQRRSKRLSALLAGVLLCGGSAAFAVASWAPARDLGTLHEVVETVRPQGLVDALSSMDQPGFRLFRTETVRASDTVDALLARMSIDDPQAADFLRTDSTSRHALFGQPWRLVSTEAGQSRGLLRLTVRWIDSEHDRLFHRLVVERRGDQWVSAVESAPLTPRMRLASAEIRTTLLDATDEARLPESIATQIVDVFDDIDFQSGMRRGDRFRVVYESLEGDGESLGAGRVLSVDFTTRSQTRQAIWFQPPGTDELTGKPFQASYYTPSGRSLRRAYLASPVEFSHVSSGFQMRTHPISKAWRQHLGVDYAAPSGTPVRSVGDGVVEFAGVQSGYGNVVIVEHHNNQSTLYAHLSKVGVKLGQVVRQGEYVGRVGATGWATGPHLHFEFRIDGVHHDPETLAEQTDVVPLTEEANRAFAQVAALMRVQLAAAESIGQVRAE